jgi:type I restriction enzyme S subunit
MEILMLSSVCSIINQAPRQFDGSKEYVATGDIQNSEIISSKEVTFQNRPSRANCTVDSGDILFAKMANTEKTLIAEEIHEKMLFSTGFAVLRPIPEVLDSGYLYHVLRSEKFLLEKDRLSSGATQKAITNKALLNIKIPIPPLNEQRKISAILDKADEVKQSFEKSTEKRDEIIRSTFLEMFGDLNINPKRWKLVLLDDLVDKLGDGIHGTPVYHENGDYFFINGTNLRDKRIEILENTKRVSELEYLKHKKELNSSTMFVSINGTVGNVAYYNGEPVMLGKSVCYFNVKESEVSRTYLYYLIKSSYFTNYARGKSTGSTIRNLSLKAMRTLPIPLPPMELQYQFAQYVKFFEKIPNPITLATNNSLSIFQELLK